MMKFLLLALQALSLTVTVTPSSYNIYTVSNYTIILTTQSQIPSGGSISVLFPSIFTQLSQGSVQCSSSQSLQCSCVFVSNILSMTNCFPLSPSTFTLNLFNVSNPIYAATSSVFTASTYSNTNTLLETASGNTLTFKPYTLTYSNILINGNVGDYTVWTLILSVVYQIPSNGFISITFPAYSATLGTGTSLSYCSSIFSCVENLFFNQSLACQCNSNTLTITVPTNFKGNLNLSLTNIHNSPTSAPISGFYVATGYSNGLIEKSSGMTLQIKNPASLILNNFQVSGSNIINTFSEYYTFSFNSPSPIAQNSTISIWFSNEFSLQQVSGVFPIFGLTSCNMVKVSNNLINVTNGFSTGYLAENSLIWLQVLKIGNPPTTKPSTNINVFIYDKNWNLVTNLLNGTSVTASPGTLQGVSITPLVSTVQVSTVYAFRFTLGDNLPSGSCILITFPPEITVQNSYGPCFYIPVYSGMSSNSICNVTSQKYVWITNAFPNGNTSNLIVFQINNVTNAITPALTNNFTISTYTDSNFQYLIDTSSVLGLSFVSDTLQNVLVTPNSYVTGDFTSYTFNITTKNIIPIQGYLEIYVPAEISLSFVSCASIQGFNSAIRCMVTNNFINVTQGFEYSAFNTGTLIFTVNNFKNPASTFPSSAFNISTKYNGFIIDSSNSFQVSMKYPHLLNSSNILVPNVPVNSLTTASITFIPFNNANITQILVVPPSEIQISAPTCQKISGLVSVQCTLLMNSSVQVSVVLKNGAFPISFNLSGVIVPGSTRPSSSFALYTSISGYQVDYCNSGLFISASFPANFSNVMVSPSDSGISVITSYVFSIKTSNTIPGQGFIQIIFPNEITFSSTTACSFQSIFNNCTLGTYSVTFTAKNSIFPSYFSLSVTGLINYNKVANSSLFQIGSFTSDNYAIDCSTNLFVIFTCHSPCLNCLNTADFCTACENQYLWNNSCHSTCATNFYPVSNFVCNPCSNSCFGCYGTSTNCTGCSAGLILFENACISQCPDYYYLQSSTNLCVNCPNNCVKCNSTQCLMCVVGYLYKGSCVDTCSGVVLNGNCYDCSTGCKSCSVLATNCTGCVSAYLFYSNMCYSQCPLRTYALNGVCFNCPVNCEVCKSFEICESCSSNYLLFNNTCVTLCPDTYFESKSACLSCPNFCKNCDNNTCMSCLPNYFLFQGSCLPSCPALSTIDINQTCFQCTNNCSTCSGSLDFCTSCQKGLLLYKNQCVSECPFPFIPINSICESCLSPCKTCSGSVFNCTSCISPYYLSEYSCVATCAINTTVPSVSGTCVPCSSQCLTCKNASDFCTTCVSGIAFMGTCLDNCPSGYYLTAGSCISLCAPGCTENLLFNDICDQECNTESCNYDNNTCNVTLVYDNSMPLSQAPFPSSSSGIASIGVSTASKYFVPSSSFLSSSVSMTAFCETASWVGLTYQISNSDYLHGRALLADDDRIVIAFSLILFFLGLHFVGNMIFVLIYYFHVIENDKVLKVWTRTHRCSSTFIVIMSCLISFKMIRSLFSNIFGLKSYGAELEERTVLYRPLLTMTYISIGCVSVPIICLLIYILSTFSSGNLVFVLALDSLIITVIVTLLSVPDIISMHNQIVLEKDRIKLPQFFGAQDDSNSNKLCIETFQIFDYKLEFDHTLVDTSRTITCTDPLKFDENLKETEKEHPDDNVHLMSTGHIFTQEFVKSDEISNFAEKPIVEYISFSNESPNDMIKIESLNSKVSQDSVAAPLPFEFEIIDSSKEYIDEENEPQLLETILEESDLNLSSAVLDFFDPECIEVQHRPSGLKVLVKKNFEDLEDGEKLTSLNYSIYEVDSQDLHYAVLRKSSSDTYLRARRNFKGSVIVDVETRGGVWLVGRIVKKEEDFDLQNARVDGENIVAVHKLSGLRFGISKNFVGAVDENEEKLEEYEGKAKVDPNDVHFGWVNSKKYYRRFEGGLITAIINQDEEQGLNDEREKGISDEENKDERHSQDNTAFFVKHSDLSFNNEEISESIKFNQEEFTNTFAEGFFSKSDSKEDFIIISQETFGEKFIGKNQGSPKIFGISSNLSEISIKPQEKVPQIQPVSIEIQTEEEKKSHFPKIESCLSLTVLDNIAIYPMKVPISDQPLITYEEPIQQLSVMRFDDSESLQSVDSQPKFAVKRFKKFENIEEESVSARSKSSSNREIVKKGKKKNKKGKADSRGSSKYNTPRNRSMKKGIGSEYFSSQESLKSIEAIYLQRLRAPNDMENKNRNVRSIHAPDSNSDLTLSIQMSLTKLNMVSAPSKHNFEMIRKESK